MQIRQHIFQCTFAYVSLVCANNDIGNYFVSDNFGCSSNPGTEYSPFKSISDALSAATADNVNAVNIHMLPGTYQGDSNVGLSFPIPTRISSVNNEKTQNLMVNFKCDYLTKNNFGFIALNNFNIDGNLIETQISSCQTGILHLSGNVTATNVKFDDITFGIFGQNTPNIVVNNCTFRAEEADTLGVSVFAGASPFSQIEIIHSEFSGCGLVARGFVNGVIKGTDFHDMSTTAPDSPIFINNGTWILSDVSVANSTSPGDGGAMSVFYTENLLIGQSSFQTCLSQGNGGALHVEFVDNLSIQDSFFSGNKAAEYGGSIFIKNGEANFREVAFLDSSAKSGAGISFYSQIIEVTVDRIYCNNIPSGESCISCCTPITYDNCEISLSLYGPIVANGSPIDCPLIYDY